MSGVGNCCCCAFACCCTIHHGAVFLPRTKLHEVFQSSAKSGWLLLFEASGRCDEKTAIAQRRDVIKGKCAEEGGSSRVEGGFEDFPG